MTEHQNSSFGSREEAIIARARRMLGGEESTGVEFFF